MGGVSDGGLRQMAKQLSYCGRDGEVPEGQEDSDRGEGKAACGERSKQECEGDAGGGRFARVSGLGGWGDGEKGRGVATPPALTKKVVEVSGP